MIFRNPYRRQIGRREVEGDDLPELRVIFFLDVGNMVEVNARSGQFDVIHSCWCWMMVGRGSKAR